MMASLDDPIARVIYMMFLVSEVYPYDDGNGRIARIMMNAELVVTFFALLAHKIPSAIQATYYSAIT